MSKYSRRFQASLENPQAPSPSTSATAPQFNHTQDCSTVEHARSSTSTGAHAKRFTGRRTPSVGVGVGSSSNPEAVRPSDQPPSRAVAMVDGSERPTGQPSPQLTTAIDPTSADKTEASPDRKETVAEDSGDEDVLLDDDVEDEDHAEEQTTAQSADQGSPSRPTLYSCDMCPHLLFISPDALRQHALEAHIAMIADYSKLHAVAHKLQPHWEEVLTRKADVLTQWGRKVFHIAEQRDAGPAKMLEAHKAREQLELVVRRWHPTAHVFIFGSSVTFGVWDGISDIDFTVVDVESMEAGTWPPPERNAVRSLTELLRRAGFSFVNLEPIQHARVPIIKHHASAPIRVELAAMPLALRAAAAGVSVEALKETEGEEARDVRTSSSSLLAAEDIISRSVRYVLNGPASPQDRVILEGSIRDALGSAGIQQVWWNRTSEAMCITCPTTTQAVQAATCSLAFASPTLRARVQPLHDECRPELHNIDFDLSFRSFGIRNSALLQRYLHSHPCARPGAIVLKDWSKTSGVNNSVNGFLTSYAVNILWIYYLVHRGVIPYVDPEGDVPASLRGNTSFAPDYCPMVDPGWDAATLGSLYQEAGDLLLGFFYYYAFEFDWVRDVVSLNRPEVTTKKMLGWDVEDVAAPSAAALAQLKSSNGASAAAGIESASKVDGVPGGGARRSMHTRYAFCIEDPYEENLNLGRHMGITKSLRVQAEFYRGMLSLLKDGEYESCVFAATDRADAQLQGGRQAQEETSMSALEAPLLPEEGTVKSPGRLGTGGRSSGSTLPHKVLYRLMAIALEERAKARQAHLAQQQTPTEQSSFHPSTEDADTESRNRASTTVSGSRAVPVNFIGVSEETLRHAFQNRAPTELALALKAWNWQQLLHRLGYKRFRGFVLPRGEVGLRRATPPPGVLRSVPATSEGGGTEAKGNAIPIEEAAYMKTPHSGIAESNMDCKDNTEALATANAAAHRLLQRGAASRGLSEYMMMVLSEGFMRLTPEWVAWSTPWASLHTRGCTFFTPKTPLPSASTPSSSTPGSSAFGSGGVGGTGGAASSRALHPTRRNSMPFSVSRMLRCILRK